MHKALKIALLVVGGLLLLLLGSIFFIESPWGQDFVRGRVQAYLQHKLKTEVRIGHLGYGIPKYIVLNDALFLDRSRDTLLAVHTLKVDLDMLQLLHSKVVIQQIIVNGMRSHIYRVAPDTNYNCTYIVEAFGSGSTNSNKKDTTASLSFRLDKLKLDNIQARFDDETGGMKFKIALDHLNLDMKKLDLDDMFFHIRDLTVAGLQTEFDQDTSYLPPTPNDTTQNRIKIKADNVDLRRIGFRYNNNLNKFLFAMQLGTLQMQLNSYNRDSNRVDLQKLIVRNSSGSLVMGKVSTAPAPIDTIIKIDTTEGWDVIDHNIDISGVSFKMDNQNVAKQPGFDYSHMNVQNLEVKAKDLTYYNDVWGDVQHFSVKEQSGLDVRELRTSFHYGDKGVILKDLFLQTPNTTVRNYIAVQYPSVADVKKNIQSLMLNLNIEKSVIGLQDVALFVPQLRKQSLFRRYERSHLMLDAKVNGTLGDLAIGDLYARGLGTTEIKMSGRLKGISDVKRLSYNLHISKFNSSRSDVVAVLPPNWLPGSFRLPDRFGAMGRLAGNTKDINADLAFASTDGGAYVKGYVFTSAGKGGERYDLAIRTVQLNLGYILGDTLLGGISAAVDVKGKGFDAKAMNAIADGNISSAYINGYRYHDITFEGNVAHQHASARLVSADANLRMQLDGTADFSGKYPGIFAEAKIDSADLQALRFYSSELRIRGRIHADIPALNPDYPRGSVKWYQPVVLANGKRYFMDSVYAISQPDDNTGQNITFGLGVADGRLTGRTPLTKIGVVIQQHIDRHYSAAIADSLRLNVANLTKKSNRKGSMVKQRQPPKMNTASIPADYNLDLFAHIYDRPLLHSLYPSLTSFDSVHLDASLTPLRMTINASTPEIIYDPYQVENAVVKITENDSALSYKMTVDQLTWGNYGLYFTDVHGTFDRSLLTTHASISDANRKERFALNADALFAGDSQVVHLQPGLKLNYDDWNVAQPNRIVLNRKGFYVQNMAIDSKGQTISANNLYPSPASPLRIGINNFQLATLTDITSINDTLIAAGTLSGNVTVEQPGRLVKMTGDVTVQGLSLYGDTLGDIRALVNNKTDDLLDTRITLTGHGSDIKLAGNYNLNASTANTFDFDLNINALAVNSFEGLAMHNIYNSSGYLRGDLKVRGSFSNPNITGELRTDNVRTTVGVINTDFRLPSDKVTFEGDKIAFDNFTVVDSAGNKAAVDGTVGIRDLANPEMNLSVTADNWRAIHSTQQSKKEIYGTLVISTKLDIRGTPTVPSVEGNVYILKGTDLTVTNPEQNPEIQRSKGIVVFVNMRDSSWGKALMPRRQDSAKLKHKLAKGSDINVNITVDREATLSLIIDQASGDFVRVKGDAYVNTFVTQSGDLEMTGTYSLHSGIYQMNYNFIRRRFEIQDGSTITFSGDPLANTNLNVTATYLANTPPYDLVQRQVTDPAELVYFKQSLPFNVDMHMIGNLQHPAFTFDVELPENKVYPLSADQIELVEAKLSQMRQDTTELNKQVFAVLILGRFVSDDPFTSEAGQGIAFAAVQSVSTFMGEQLNKFANQFIKGVDLTVDMATTADYTTGDMRQRTDLNVAASKRLLNDRLKLTVGNYFEVEGLQTANNGQSGLPSNLAADYLLSSDGRYTVRAYRRNYDEGALEGYVTETGVNFIVSVDYNRFKTVFMRSKRKRSVPGSLAK